MTVAAIGSLASSQTGFVLPQASSDLSTDMTHANEILVAMKNEGIVNIERKLETVSGAGVEVNIRNLYRPGGLPNLGDGDPYENADVPKYGNRSLNINKFWKSFEFDRPTSFSQQMTSIDLQKFHPENYKNYFADLFLKGLMTQGGSATNLSLSSPDLDLSGITGTDRTKLTMGNAAIAPSGEYHQVAGELVASKTPQTLTSSDTLTVGMLMKAATEIGKTRANLTRWNIKSVNELGCVFIAQSDLFNLMNQSVSIGNNYVFGDVYQRQIQAKDAKEIGGIIHSFTMPGIPFKFWVLPDSYFEAAVSTADSSSVANTRRLFILGRNALDVAFGRINAGKDVSSPFVVKVDNNWKPLGVKSFGLAQGAFGGKKAQIPNKSTGTATDWATYTIDVHTGA